MTDTQQFNIRFRPKSRKRIIGYTDAELDAITKNVKGAKCVLFYGGTGSGKTTLLKLIAEELTDKDNINEVNAGADGGIDEIRKMITVSKRRTLSGKRRINIIDEAHKLTRQAIDALLVPTEAEDLSTLWMFASNEPERLPPVLLRRMLKVKSPDWTEKRLLRLAKRVNKETGAAIPKNLKQFNNPSDMLVHMQQPGKDAGTLATGGNPNTARYVLSCLLGNTGGKRVNYDFKFSTIMEISLAIRGTLGAILPYETPDATMMATLRKTDPKLVARIANGCSVALRDDTKPPMVLLDILFGAVAAPYHFEK